MSITSFQTGTLSFASGDLTKSATLNTTVTQGNSILLVSVRGGSNTVEQAGVRVGLSSDGTTVTATRVGTGSTLTVEYQVVESSLFTVQHFEETLTTNGANAIAITSVDTNYSFPIYGGLTSTGSTRGWDDVYGLEITSATNVNAQVVDSNAGSVVVNFQIVEMSANEIASVQLHKVDQIFMNRNTTITSVDTGKTLLFGGAIFNGSSGGDLIASDEMPDWELTTSTNLKTTSFAARNELQCWIYVVEFVNLVVNTVRVSSSTGTSETEVLGATPTHGGVIINGIMGKYSSASDADDDSNDNMWTAALSGSAWTFERGSTTTGSLSYSTFDWNNLASGPVITDVDGDGEITDGQTGATVSLSGFTSTPTLKLKHGAFVSPALSFSGDEAGGTWNVPDYAATETDVIGVPIGQAGTKLLAENGAETAEFDITINPKAGWSVIVAASAGTGLGYLTDDPVADGSVGYYPQTNNQLLHTDFAYESDVTGFTGVLWNSDTGIVEKVTVSEPAAPDNEDPSIPVNVVAISTGTTTGSASCDAATDNVAVVGYRFFLDGVEQGTSPTPSYSFTGLSPAETYSVTVSAFDEGGNESAQSAPDTFTTAAVPDNEDPSIPSNVAALKTGPYSGFSSWSASTDNTAVVGYGVYLNGSLDGVTLSTSYNFTGLAPDTDYTVTVTAFDGSNNESPQSVAANFRTDPPSTGGSEGRKFGMFGLM